MKINILGTDYEIIHTTDKVHEELKDADGWCSNYTQKIYLETNLLRDEVENEDTIKARSIRAKDTLRHEIIHAYIKESAAQHSVLDHEYCVHWIALMFPKLLKTFQEADAL